eukprot:6002168-Prymnesium_polylepis.1
MRGAGTCTVELVPTEINPSDIFTKILSRQVFEIREAPQDHPQQRFGGRRLYADGTGFDLGSILMHDHGHESPHGDEDAVGRAYAPLVRSIATDAARVCLALVFGPWM